MRRWIVVPAVLLALGVAACTGDGSGGAGEKDAAPTGPSVIAPGKPGESNKTLSPEEAASAVPDSKPNDADFSFMRDMVLHHSQAIEMTDLAADSAVARKVKGIADRIGDAQGAEIKMLNLWLKQHGREPLNVPGAKGYQPPKHGEHGEHDEHASMPGMASEQELADLGSARGAKFDQLFLKLMITHHEGALTMARDVQQKGAAVRVQEIADEIIATQSAEIAKMRAMQRPG
ncbi:MAG: DUF305 domain-containing protein [Thermocrispum sp.]